MALDGIFLSLTLDELSEKIVGSRVDKIYQLSKREFIFVLRSRSYGSLRLFLSASGTSARIGLTVHAAENPDKPPMFCMLLRKHLSNALITGLEQLGLDRVVFLRFKTVNELGDTVNETLALEIMAQSSNLILLDADNVIIDAVHRVYPQDNKRILFPGQNYIPPSDQQKNDLRICDPSDLASEIFNSGPDLSVEIMRRIQGVSPLIARELAFECSGLDDLVERLTLIKTIVTSKKTEPYLFIQNDEPFDFSYMPVRQYGSLLHCETKESFSSLLDDFFYDRDLRLRIKSKSDDLFKTVDALIAKISRGISLMLIDLEKTRLRDKKKLYAELIEANIYRLPSSVSSYTVENYYDSGALVTIPVSPLLSPAQNCQKYYKEYRKAVTAEKILKERISSGETDLEYLRSVRYSLELAATYSEISQIRDDLAQNGFIRVRSQNNKRAKPPEPAEYESPGGYRILVGKNSAQNELITFKVASKKDWWFHAQKTPGSHVVLLSDGKKVPDEDMEYAAALAAFYSQKRGRGSVEVDYTMIKSLNKPTGGRSGFVTYHEYKSCVIRDADKMFTDT